MKEKILIFLAIFFVFWFQNDTFAIKARNNLKSKHIKKIANKKIREEDRIEILIKKWNLVLKNRFNYAYIPINFDPFEPIKRQILKPAPIRKGITIFFKDYSISELKLTGIVKVENRLIAIIEDPLGRGFFIKKGDYVGKEAGVVTKVTRCKIYISRQYIDPKGNIIFDRHPAILNLHEEDKTCSE